VHFGCFVEEMNVKRLMKESKELLASNEFKLHTVNDSLFEWSAALRGPPGSPFEGGTFLLSLNIPFEYPMKPPAVKVISYF
jgi:ubiquitin-protein ligase